MRLEPSLPSDLPEGFSADADGTRWIYNGGASALIGHLIARGTGRPLPQFARAALFDPLGIGPTDWIAGADGTPSAASGLRMTPRDLARIGQLVLDGGSRDGHTVVPASWLAEVVTPRIAIGGTMRYGYQWYLDSFPVGSPARDVPWVGANGNGGQRLYVLPALKLAVAITAGNYNRPGQSAAPLHLMRQVILPTLRA